MEQFNNEFFGFGTETNEDVDQNNFNYNSISGLGESNYENEDLFATEVENDFTNDFRISDFEKNESEKIITNEENFNTNDKKIESNPMEEEFFKPVENTEEIETLNGETPIIEPKFEEPNVQPIVETPIIEPKFEEPAVQPVVETSIIEPKIEETVEPKKEIELSETPIEELKKLTEYKEDKIEQTDINSLFDKVSVNVQDASDIFRKNTDLKQKIDTRFEELKKLQSEIEISRKKQKDEINSYKEEVLNKLTEKKAEIEKRLNLLKDTQATLEKEKQEFEQYKKKEQDNIENIQKEVQSAYDDRREELSHIEDVLRKQKDALDEERNQLSLDRIQYESDKNELANNLLKFNDLVNSFKDGVGEIRE